MADAQIAVGVRMGHVEGGRELAPLHQLRPIPQRPVMGLEHPAGDGMIPGQQAVLFQKGPHRVLIPRLMAFQRGPLPHRRQGTALRQKIIKVDVQNPLHGNSLPVSTVYHFSFPCQHAILQYM